MDSFWQANARRDRILRRFALLVLVLLLPAAVLAFYARPSADDYIYAAQTHAVWQQYGFDLPRLLQAAWNTNAYYYNNWQGLYVSGFVLALHPGLGGGRFYGVTFFVVAAVLYLALWGALCMLVRRLLPGQKSPLAWCTALLLLYAFVQGMPSPVEGLYWYNGAMNYLPFFAMAVLNAAIAAALCLEQNRRRSVWLAACGVVLSLLIGGGHQVVGVLNLLLLAILWLCCKSARSWRALPIAAALAGLAANLFAPGTRVRTAGFAQAGLVEAAVKSLLLAAMQCIRWLDVPLLCLLVLLAPPLYCLAGSAVLPQGIGKQVWAAPAATGLLMWAMLFLPSYTMGGIGAGRLLNVVWMTFVLGLAVTLFLLLARWRQGGGRMPALPQAHHRTATLAAAAMLLCMACIGADTVKEGNDNHFATSLEAAYELADGQAQRFAAALDAREALLSDPAQPQVEIRPLVDAERPYLLFFTDVHPGPDRWGLTPYYQKESVTIVEP